GIYSIEIPVSNSVLVFSYLGFSTEEVSSSGKIEVNVMLKMEDSDLEEIVIVGYGTQKRHSVTGAISQISGDELLKAPVGNINNMLVGRVSGVVSLQASGQPGSDDSVLFVRDSAA